MNKQHYQKKKKMVTFKRKNENLNIKTLLKDLYSQIVVNDKKTAQKIELALASLSKYPLQITSGEGCGILQGFDKNLCRYIDEHLLNEELCRAPNNTPILQISQTSNQNLKQNNVVSVTEEVKKNNGSQNFEYFHVVNKVDALILALHKQELEYPYRATLNKNELIMKAQHYCNHKIESWRFMKLLAHKHTYIETELRNGVEEYSLTSMGKDAVMNIGGSKKKTPNFKPIKLDHRVPSSEDYVTVQPPLNSLHLVHNDYPLFIDMPPGSYDIVMLVDKNEPEMFSRCNGFLKSESRCLKVGDVIWVARSKTDSQELVLPYILERKRMDDFAASIKDGRFHEQKFRLRKCGLKNVIYLIEDHQGNKNCGLPMATLNQAKANTRVQDGFLVHQTESQKATKRFLDMMTLRLIAKTKGTHLRGSNTDTGGKDYMTFEFFNASASKTKPLIIKELFIKMLLQLKGLSVEKALAITKSYNSPLALMNAYDDPEIKEPESMLANLRFNNITPRVSPTVSNVIYMLFNKIFS